jgi:hypothetical protein
MFRAGEGPRIVTGANVVVLGGGSMLVVRLKQVEDIKRFVNLGQVVIQQAERKGEGSSTLEFLNETLRHIAESAEEL